MLSFEFSGSWSLWSLFDRLGYWDEASGDGTVTGRLDFDLATIFELAPVEASWVVLEVVVFDSGGGQLLDLRLPSAVGSIQ